jgi:phage/plasmid primase-like uncharacterized protein
MSFVLFARAHGVEIGDLISSDRIRRCATTQNPRKKNGAYFWDGTRGFVFAWDGDARAQWYEDPNARPWTDAEKRAWAVKRQTAAAEQERKNKGAALHAAVLMRSAVPGPHDYLVRKGLAASQGLVLPDGALMVPMRSLATNELQGAQLIRWISADMRWEKKMVPGMKAKGAVLRLGKTVQETILCEGYATGLSIELAARSVGLSACVMVCFSDSNMVHVSRLLDGTRGRRFVFADNDKTQAGERAAKETGLPYCMSDVLGEDANDLHARAGLMAVSQLLMNVRRREVSLSG